MFNRIKGAKKGVGALLIDYFATGVQCTALTSDIPNVP